MKVKLFLSTILLINFLNYSSSLLTIWSQCGGSTYSGSDKTCDSCCLCYTQNSYYAQCLTIGTCGPGWECLVLNANANTTTAFFSPSANTSTSFSFTSTTSTSNSVYDYGIKKNNFSILVKYLLIH